MHKLQQFDGILILAGAGFSADSGLPVFRGEEGFYTAYPPFKDISVPFEYVASPDFAEAEESLFTAFYAHRLDLYRKTEPHCGYADLLQAINENNLEYFVVTTNVDGHFERAGYDPLKIHEKHGSINHYRCVNAKCFDEHGLIDAPASLKSDESLVPSFLPKCEHCGSLLRPSILLFNDWLWQSPLSNAQEKRYSKWVNGMFEKNKRVLILEFGAGPDIPSLRILHNQLLMTDPEWAGYRVNLDEKHSEASMWNMWSYTGRSIDFIHDLI